MQATRAEKWNQKIGTPAVRLLSPICLGREPAEDANLTMNVVIGMRSAASKWAPLLGILYSKPESKRA
jgi:hypothetical protein